MELLIQILKKRRREFVCIGATWILSLLFWISPWSTSIDNQIARPIDFKVRQWLGQEPSIDPRLKIFGYDDVTAGIFRTSDLSLSDWSWLLKGIDKATPQAVYIDKMFTFADPANVAFAKAIDDLKAIQTPVVAGAFTSKTPIQGRAAISPAYFESKSRKIANLHIVSANSQQFPSSFDESNSLPYGPHESILQSFAAIGHIEHQGMGLIQPIKKVFGDFYLPHWAFSLAQSIHFNDGGLMVDGVKVPTDQNGNLLANLIDPKAIELKVRNFAWLAARIRDNQLRSIIHPGDVVVLLPNLFTGNTDVKNSPVGRIPGGFVLVAILNSFLTNHWLEPMSYVPLQLFVCTTFALIVGTISSPLWFAAFLAGSSITLFIGAGLLFSFGGIYSPWLFWEVTLWTSCGLIYFDQLRRRELHRKRLRASLEGMVEGAKLDELLDQEQDLQLEVREQFISIMFVDIVEFSAYAEQREPREVFGQLRDLLNSISSTVHSFGGIVDRALGDGLLCYFGYQFSRNSEHMNRHADAAMNCALQIQREHMARTLKGTKVDELINPIRIGINTANVFIGDLGTNGKIDFTVIGHGVNFAQRLEAACEPSRIMLTQASFEQMKQFNTQDAAFSTRLIRIKNQTQPTLVYEYDPFIENQKSLEKALANYRKKRGISRQDSRRPIPSTVTWKFNSEFGMASLINFSNFGFAIYLQHFLAKGLRFHLKAAEEVAGISEFARHQLHIPLIVEVRWGRKHLGGYLHGVLVQNMDATQLEHYISSLGEALQALTADNRTAS